MVEVGGHTSKHVFHDVNSYSLIHGVSHGREFTICYQCFPQWKLSLIHGNQHSLHPKKYKKQ